MLLDFVPEALHLGTAAATGSSIVNLLAGMIAMQNMPEGLASYRVMQHSEGSNRWLWLMILTVPLVGLLAAWLGFSWISTSTVTIGGA